MDLLTCHEERIVFQPLPALLAKCVEGATVGVGAIRKESTSRLAKKLLFEGDYGVVRYMIDWKGRRVGEIRRGQKPFLTKSSQIDEQGISGKCREALVRGVAVSRGAER